MTTDGEMLAIDEIFERGLDLRSGDRKIMGLDNINSFYRFIVMTMYKL
jgi:hypothetical protein